MPRARVLVIDDDPLFRSLLTSMLRKECIVSVASDGAEGYYKALEQPPHLAIVDIQMPGWDGLKTLNAFRCHHLLSHIPVMMLTSDSSRQTVMAAIQGGARDYVIKTTLSREDFLQKVGRQLEGVKLAQSDSESASPAESSPAGERPVIHRVGGAQNRAGTADPVTVIADVETGLPGPMDLQQILDHWD